MKNSSRPDEFDDSKFVRYPPGGFQATVLSYQVLTRDNLTLDQFSDSYIFIYSYKGSAMSYIDFNQFMVSHGNALIITPGQVFRCENPSDDAVALALVISKSCILNEMKEPMNFLMIDSSPFPVTERQGSELLTIFNMLQERNGENGVHCEGADAMLARAYASIMIEALNMRNNNMSREKQSCLPLLIKLSHLFETELRQSRLPSHFASKLEISPNYLNEKIKNSLGTNISLLIRRESILRACRLLAITDMSIKEVASDSGYDDPAYFTRLFTKIVGMTPSVFRAKNSRNI